MSGLELGKITDVKTKTIDNITGYLLFFVEKSKKVAQKSKDAVWISAQTAFNLGFTEKPSGIPAQVKEKFIGKKFALQT
ncbi:MAG: hypothetical protein QF824_01945 [Candidatus Woesearchaeota archaeon]|jgi:hypothetical protein|nr:hypothetical protein [Candidatus Woesearchaeota archaeon]